jgi:large subunit ribosomal protein L29
MANHLKDYKELSVSELDKKFRDIQDELLQARLSKQTGQLEKTHLLKELRRDTARIRTLLQQKAKASVSA